MSQARRYAGILLVLGLILPAVSCQDEPSVSTPSLECPTCASGTQALAVSFAYEAYTPATSAASNTALTYVFAASATGGTAPYRFAWRFGDGAGQVTGNPVRHEFAEPGTYTVLATVTDSLGNAAVSDPDAGVIEISAEVKLACFADPTEGDSGLSVAFRAIMRNSTGRATYLWDFGDGQTSSERIVTHTYHADPGVTTEFRATATATDNATQLSCTKTITVVGPDVDVDDCPHDPTKTAPGVCGCGTPDTDHDGTPDCIDNCPNDPNKINPGICGCGTPDTDADGDEIPDCLERPCAYYGESDTEWLYQGSSRCHCPANGDTLWTELFWVTICFSNGYSYHAACGKC